MRVHTFVDEGLGHSSYLLDLGDGTAAVVDPPRFPVAHEARARQDRLVIRWTIDTHSHADYVTGSPALAARAGATFLAPAAARLETPTGACATASVSASPRGWCSRRSPLPATPPTTPRTWWRAAAAPRPCSAAAPSWWEPWAAPTCADPRTRPRSPGRCTGRCGASPGSPTPWRCIPRTAPARSARPPGRRRASPRSGTSAPPNPLLRGADEDAFVATLLDGLGTFPPYFARLPEVNRRGPRRFDALPDLPRLDVGTVARHRVNGALIVDARPVAEFGPAHVPGALSNALRPAFATWLGWLVDPERPLVFLLDDDQGAPELVRQCLTIGFEQLLGVLDGGIDAWVAAGHPVASIPLVGVHGIAPMVLDVRQAQEFAAGHVPGARNVELGTLLRARLPDEPVTVMCGHGERAMTAASLLAARGRRQVSVFEGGPDTWARATGRALQVGP